MSLLRPWVNAQNLYRRKSAELFSRKVFDIETSRPIISFTFDDFPRSALWLGGAILEDSGLAGTYYVSLGLLGNDSPNGRIADATDLPRLVAHGHELGCHTFAHCDSWETEPAAFEGSIIENRRALSTHLSGVEFKTFSYPISLPRPTTKSRVAKHFLCSRAGGQTCNTGKTDLNQLSAFFLEKSTHRIQEVKRMIDSNRQALGWLIFATHDVSQNPSPFGCTPEFFAEIVRYAVSSGSLILPVVRALEMILGVAKATEEMSL